MASRFRTFSSISSLPIRRLTGGSVSARGPAAPLPKARPGARRPVLFHVTMCVGSGLSSICHAEGIRLICGQLLQARAFTVPAGALVGFDKMAAGSQRKFYMLGGKGGVGKTSCAASLAVRFANQGHPTMVVSTDPAHSLSDSFAQDLSGGVLVPVDGVDSPLFALEINPERAKEEFRNATKKSGGTGVKDFMDGLGLGMLAEQLKQKLASATSAIKSMFGKEGPNLDFSSDKLEQLRDRMTRVRELFRDKNSTEFIIVTIPTVMAISESSRLCASLRKESVPVRRLIVNQVLQPSTSDCKFCAMRRKDQDRALDMIHKDSELNDLSLIQSPLLDAEIRGVSALKFIGGIVWK